MVCRDPAQLSMASLAGSPSAEYWGKLDLNVSRVPRVAIMRSHVLCDKIRHSPWLCTLVAAWGIRQQEIIRHGGRVSHAFRESSRLESALASLQQHLSGLSVFVYACSQAQDTASTKFSVSLAELLPDRLAVRVFVHITPCPGTRNVQKGRQGPSWRGS